MKVVSLTKLVVHSTQKPTVIIKVDGRDTKIPVSSALKADFTNQFVRPNPSALQKRKFRTLKALMASAYAAGRASEE
jgi:hypothetical protein